MIVRINQIDAARVEAEGGWPAGGHAGSFRGPWPADFRAFELLILSEDERRQPLSDAFRQQQLRQMIPQTAIALSPPGGPDGGGSAGLLPVVVRLDGRIVDGELLPAWRHLTDADGRGRYAFAGSAKLDEVAGPPAGSVRIAPSWRLLSQICGDPALGLERTVRLRLMSLPPAAVPGVLDGPSDVEDPRWAQLLGECQLYVGTTAGLRGLHLLVRGLDAAQVKARIMQRLMAVARGAPAVPA